MKKPKNKKQMDENALTLRRALSNDLLALRTVHKAAPLYLPTYFLWSVFGALINFFLYTWLLREVVNRYTEGKSMTYLLTMIGIIAVAYVLQTIFIYWVTTFILPKANTKIKAAFQKQMFEKAKQVELECYENPQFYDKYVRAMQEVYNKSMDVVYGIDSLIWNIINLVTIIGMMLVIDPVIAAISFLPLLTGLVAKKTNKIGKDRDDACRPIDRQQVYVQRIFYLNEFAKEMRLTNMPSLMKARYRQTLDDYTAVQKKYGYKLAALNFLSSMIPNIVFVLSSVYAAFQTLLFGNMRPGDFLIVFNNSGMVSGNMRNMINNFENLRKTALYIEDFRYFMSYEPKIQNKPNAIPASAGELRMENVSFRYAGAENDVLKHISLHIASGEKIALVGHNGSGKSTLVKLLLHLYEPREGAVTLNGRPLSDYDMASLAEQFAVVFQDPKLLSLSVAENILLRPMEAGDEEKVVEALRQSGGWEKVSSFKNGIRTTLTREFDDEGEVLSGGEAQKVSLARIFACDSPFVILDEPSSALDPIAEYKMFDNMIKACEGRSLIFISHRLASAVLADRIYLLDDGEIIESGGHAELLEKGGKYAEMFRKQAENYVKEGSGDDGSEE